MSDSQQNPSRRSVLGIAFAGMAANLQKVAVAAGSADRVLVCVYLIGGNDGNNLIVPLDSAQYQAYARLRGPLALASGDLLPVQAAHNAGTYGFHPALSELRDLYNQGAVAVVANVGNMRPRDPRQGHAYDSMAFLRGGYFTPRFAANKAGLKVTDTDSFLTTPRGVSMVSLDGGSAAARAEIAQAARSVRFRTPFPATGAGNALAEVAGLMRAARAGGVRNPVFTVPMSGFDTHGVQLSTQASLFGQLSGAMAAFYAAAEEAGMAGNVTVFTDSEFGRAITPNPSGGSDHGWGNHQLVMGGSVLGHDIYGTFPDMAAGGRNGQGGWVPTTAQEQYLATLANWAGIPYSDLRGAFPQLDGNANLGFMA
jgi:uncharacterized protein (DUF1501 family)